jgi:phosphate transport system substrate-binding protein
MVKAADRVMKSTGKRGISRAVASLIVVAIVVLVAVAYLAWSGSGRPGGSGGVSGFNLTQPVTLSAGGSTFINPLMQQWITQFHQTYPLISINYQAIGSGAGQQGIFTNTFDFAGSDAPVSDQQLANLSTTNKLLQIPESLGGVAIFYNIPQLGQRSINLTGGVIAGIYLGQITEWDDPAIATLNPGVTLPHQTIIPVHRSDGSGTTYAFTDYLSTISSDWAIKVGKGTSVSWPSFELAGKGSSGVAGLVETNSYSIGYADTVYATENNLPVAAVQNREGQFVIPTIQSVSAAASQFSSQLQSDTRVSIVNAPGADSYPIATFTYILVWRDQTDLSKGYAISHFLWWVVNNGQGSGAALGYSPLPQNVVAIDDNLVKQIDYNGQSFIST